MLQKAIAIVVDPELRSQILESIKAMSGSLCQTKYGNKVLNKLQKVYPDIFDTLNQSRMSIASTSSGMPGAQYKKKSANRKYQKNGRQSNQKQSQ